MLIIVAILVFYNEYNKNMNIAEIGLLIVALIAIIRASMNYINLGDTINLEGFTDTRNRSNKSRGKKKMEDIVVLESRKSKEYFDTNEEQNNTLQTTTPQTTHHFLTSLTENKIDANAVNQVNSLLGMSAHSQSNFDDIPLFTTLAPTTKAQPIKAQPIKAQPTKAASTMDGSIESKFNPQIQIGKGVRDSLSRGFTMQGMNMNSLGGLGVPNVASLASTASALGVGDNMSFPNTMKPSSNLWSSDLDYIDTSKNWVQSMADYNNGKWNPNTYSKASDYIDYYTPSAYGMNTPPNTNAIGIGQVFSSNTGKSHFDNILTSNNTTPATTMPATTMPATTMPATTMPATTMPATTMPATTMPATTTPATTTPATTMPATTMPQPTILNSNGQPAKLCGAYDDLDMDQAGNLVVQNYTQAKKWMPGYTYIPPVYWDVPQKHVSVCNAANPNARKLTGLVDRGLPINALELNPDGSMATTEDTVSLTNVGSIIPSFNYEETPFSKPYI